MALSAEDRAAIAQTAQRLGVSPYSLGALLDQESSLRPTVWGGAGGKYFGSWQASKDAQAESGLDPAKHTTIASQMGPFERYALNRGFKPGKHGIEQLYGTVLIGNANANLNQSDSFGTNALKAAQGMKPGGERYERIRGLLGDVASGPLPQAAVASATPVPAPKAGAAGGGADWSTALFGDIFGDEPSSRQEPAPKADPVPAFRPADLGALPVALMDSVEPGRMAGDRLRRTADNDPFLAAALANSPRPEPVAEPVAASSPAPMPAASSGAVATTGELLDGEVDIVSVGKRLQGLGFKVAENPHFGDGRVGKHSPNSHHYAGHALDLTIQPGSPLLAGRKDSDWNALTSQWGAKLKAAFPGAEIFHPGDDPVGGHNSHIHLALPGGRGRASKLARELGLA